MKVLPIKLVNKLIKESYQDQPYYKKEQELSKNIISELNSKSSSFVRDFKAHLKSKGWLYKTPSKAFDKFLCSGDWLLDVNFPKFIRERDNGGKPCITAYFDNNSISLAEIPEEFKSDLEHEAVTLVWSVRDYFLDWVLFQNIEGLEWADNDDNLVFIYYTTEYQLTEEITDSILWYGYYRDTRGKDHKVYFIFNSDDFDEAERELNEIIPEPYIKAVLKGDVYSHSTYMWNQITSTHTDITYRD